MDKVIIEGLSCFGRHGVLPEENKLGQNFIVSCQLYYDFTRAAETDDIENAVNYAEVAEFITEYVRDNVFKLIETLASRLACELLKRYGISKVEIRIDKPSAPIDLPFGTVAVSLCRRWSKAYIGLGSNMGDKKMYLDMAVNELKADDNIRLLKVADYIETEPYGYEAQDRFLNSAAEIETLYSPHELLNRLRAIEQLARRERKIHWGPRTLDLDILMYEDSIINDEELTIPHIDMANREFVLKPLCSIAPYAIDPVTGMSVKEMYERLKERSNN